jgi:hypothetical protein
MKCPECGTRLPTGTKECHFCGYHISIPIDQPGMTTQSDSYSVSHTDIIPTVREKDSNEISLLAIFIAMMAFVTTFANFYYQSTGTYSSVSTINLTSNITTTTYYPKSFIVFGIPLEGYVISLLMAIFAFVVATMAWSVLMRFSKKS